MRYFFTQIVSALGHFPFSFVLSSSSSSIKSHRCYLTKTMMAFPDDSYPAAFDVLVASIRKLSRKKYIV